MTHRKRLSWMAGNSDLSEAGAVFVFVEISVMACLATRDWD